MNLSKHSFSRINVFISVAKAGSIVRASEILDVNPSTISRQLSFLEDSLGNKLFQRKPRKLEVTNFGKKALKHYTQAFIELEKIEKLCNPEIIPVRITSSYLFGEHILLKVIKFLSNKYPHIKLEIDLCDTVHDLSDLSDDFFDIAICGYNIKNKEMTVKPIMPLELVFVCHPDIKKEATQHSSKIDIAGLKWVIVEDVEQNESGVLRLSEDFTLDITQSTNKLVVSDHKTALNCALAGLGVAGIERIAVEEFIANGTLVDIFPSQNCTIGNYWIYMSNRNPIRQEVSTIYWELSEKLKLTEFS